jgi:hypothetical protein
MTTSTSVAVIAPMMVESGTSITIKDCLHISRKDKELDDMDEYNKPRLRRALILTSLPSAHTTFNSLVSSVTQRPPSTIVNKYNGTNWILLYG